MHNFNSVWFKKITVCQKSDYLNNPTLAILMPVRMAFIVIILYNEVMFKALPQFFFHQF